MAYRGRRDGFLMREPVLLWVPMVPGHSELIYIVGMDYEGRIGSKFTFVHKGILVIVQGYTGVSEQGLVNLDFDDNKTRFRTNDHISSVIRQDGFQSGNHKDKSSQRRNHEEEDHLKEKSSSRPKLHKISL
uniref:Uncharacterized protein n=1 Tax=Vitis vinifera TaxID=29760 RepID=A5AKP3_VITVI|nr:hypothetical protein VITISV_028336 [Vitis vinifera]